MNKHPGEGEKKEKKKTHPLPEEGEMEEGEEILGMMFQAQPRRERPTGANKNTGGGSPGGERWPFPKPKDQSTAVNGSGRQFSQIAEAVGPRGVSAS